MPYRRDVHYLTAQDAPIAPLLDRFEFVEDRSRWGAKFRFGLFAISDHDMQLIAQAMRADLAALGLQGQQPGPLVRAVAQVQGVLAL